MTSARLDKLEEILSHQSSTIEDLNMVVTDQSNRIDALQRRVALLMKRAAEQESDDLTGAPVADQKPPHW